MKDETIQVRVPSTLKERIKAKLNNQKTISDLIRRLLHLYERGVIRLSEYEQSEWPGEDK